jgi:methionine synthase I (cobalamin-dependent)
MSPGEFAAIVSDCVKMGAGIIGGCCGTAPGFIEAAVKTIRG